MSDKTSQKISREFGIKALALMNDKFADSMNDLKERIYLAFTPERCHCASMENHLDVMVNVDVGYWVFTISPDLFEFCDEPDSHVIGACISGLQFKNKLPEDYTRYTLKDLDGPGFTEK